ncbi:FbpB family small basic protein [Bacillus manliponensis]
MRRKVRKSFQQLLLENKQTLLNNKDSMKAIEEKIEKRHISTRKPVME